jgi:poly-gamma-glutamate synthesis protein (capsule biosynthesis protein)
VETRKDDVVTLCAVGDVALCDGVARGMRQEGIGFPFHKIKAELSRKDVSFANLENVFADGDPGLQAQAHLLGSETANVEALQHAGFDVVSLATNHIMDFGASGLERTMSALDRLSIRHCGAGASLAAARRPAVLEAKGIRFGFLAYAMKGVQSADRGKAGASWIDYDMIAEDVRGLTPTVDHVVVSLHAGMEFIDYPHPDHRQLCLRIAELGPSLIVGHHPHVIHGIEQSGDCLIAYSLGNLVFDTTIMDYETERSSEGLILRCTFRKDRILGYEAVPTVIGEGYLTALAEGSRKESILERLDALSRALASPSYPGVYFRQAGQLWPAINIAVNLKIIREQGVRAFLRRLPRLKAVYVALAFKYVCKRILRGVGIGK